MSESDHSRRTLPLDLSIKAQNTNSWAYIWPLKVGFSSLKHSLRLESSEADEERKADIENHKHDQLKKQEEGKGHWKRELGSNSESAVRGLI